MSSTLERLTLRNFQAHRSLEIDLAPGITSIVGPSDVGKSAIIRALTWVCLNRPQGLEFIRSGAKWTEVVLQGQNKKSHWHVVRSRSKSENYYGLSGDDFRAFGAGVPPEIAELLGVAGINFQAQHDAPFWFSETSGEVSRQLNQIINLGIIDTALAHTASEVRRTREETDRTIRDMEEAKRELEKARSAEDMDPHLKEVEEVQGDLHRTEGRADRLDHLLQRAHTNEKLAVEARSMVDGASPLLRAGEGLKGLSERLGRLLSLTDSLEQLKAQAKPPPEEDFASLVVLQTRLEGASSRKGRLATLITKARTADTTWTRADLELTKAKNAFDRRTKGELCPTCKNPIR